MFKYYKNDKEFKRDKAIEELQSILPTPEMICHCENDFKFAELFYDRGVRVIHENEVIITKKELQTYEFVKKQFGSENEVKASEITNVLRICDTHARKETVEQIANSIEDVLQVPFEGKTDKQKWQRKGMEEGLKMALEICKEIMEEVDNGK